MSISKSDYCIKICGAKCCTLHLPDAKVKCEKLNPDNTCSIYEKRFAEKAPEKQLISLYVLNELSHRPTVGQFWCWRIDKLLAHNLLPAKTREQCCYAHPELLEANYGIKTGNS